jgi:hypothetical protein
MDAEVKRVETEYPDIAPPIISLIADLRAQVENLSNDASRRTEHEAAQAKLDTQERLAREEQALAEAHPDWNDVVRTETFVDLGKRSAADGPGSPSAQRHIGRHRRHAESAKILSDFKRDTAPPAPAPDPLAQRRESQLDGSRHIPPRAPAMETRPLGGGTVEEEFELARQEELRAARR